MVLLQECISQNKMAASINVRIAHMMIKGSNSTVDLKLSSYRQHTGVCQHEAKQFVTATSKTLQPQTK